MKTKLAWLFTVACCCLTLLEAAELKLAVRGQAPQYEIVISQIGGSPYANAAQEFQSFIQQQTGVKLPIIDDTMPLPAAAVLIGPNKHTAALLGDGYRPKELGNDAFILKTVGPHVVVLGGRRGAQYGVYELLERFGGCRWYASWHSKIPKLDAFAVPADLNETQRPAFFMREPFWYDMFNTYQAIRNKCNGNRMNLGDEHGGKVRFGGGLFVHTLGRLVPVEQFFKTHPEYFSEIDGTRISVRAQLCLSNPDVLRLVTERVLAKIRKDPNATLYSVSQNDWLNPCQCANCKALVEKYGGTQSGIMIWFVNQVAEAIEKEFPNALIETLAYQYTREPPKKIRPRHNVVPRLCTIECDFAHSLRASNYESNKKFLKDIEGWAAISKRLYIWDYVTDFSGYLTPYPNFWSIPGNLQLFRDCHVLGVMSQGAYQGYHGDFAELKGWVTAKLMWNPDQPVEPLLDDFFNGYYGKAAPYVREYFNLLHSYAKNPDFVLTTFTAMPNGYLSPEFLRKGEELWKAAEAAVKDDPAFLYNVQKGALTIYNAQLMCRPRIKPTFIWTDDALVPDDMTRPYMETATNLLRCAVIKDKRHITYGEGTAKHDEVMKYWHSFVCDTTVRTIKKDGMSISIAPAMGGLAGILKSSDGINYLNGNFGGISFTPLPEYTMDIGAAKVIGESADSLTTETPAQRHAKQTVTLKLADGNVHAECELKNNQKDKPLKLFASFTVGLNIGKCGNIFYKFDDAQWKDLAIQSDETNTFALIHSDEFKGARTLTIASPSTKRGIAITLPQDIKDSDLVRLQIHALDDAAKFMFIREFALPPNGKAGLVASLKPLDAIQGLPALFTPAPSDKGKVRLAINADNMTISKPGFWGDHVSDPEAENGHAIKMYGVHYEWCFRAHANFTSLSPNTKYRMRVHVKVEKSGKPGEAFWTGVYDQTTKKHLGQTNPPVDKVPEGGYQWYTALEWVPARDHNLWIWAGPGRFRGDKNCAAKAVYIDKIELIPLD